MNEISSFFTLKLLRLEEFWEHFFFLSPIIKKTYHFFYHSNILLRHFLSYTCRIKGEFVWMWMEDRVTMQDGISRVNVERIQATVECVCDTFLYLLTVHRPTHGIKAEMLNKYHACKRGNKSRCCCCWLNSFSFFTLTERNGLRSQDNNSLEPRKTSAENPWKISHFTHLYSLGLA